VACGLIENVLQTIFLPICMYTGLYRFTEFSKTKTQYFYTALSQEILLH